MALKNENFLAGLLAGAIMLIGTVGYLLGLIWLRVVTFLWLWVWFVVPLGATPLAFWHAAGLLGIVGFLTMKISTKLKIEDEDKVKAAIIYPVSYTLAALGIGYFIHLMMA